MNKRNLLIAIPALCSGYLHGQTQPASPNVIYILMDDLGYGYPLRLRLLLCPYIFDVEFEGCQYLQDIIFHNDFYHCLTIVLVYNNLN